MAKNDKKYFLGADLGATKTHVVIADDDGQVLGFGHGGPANHQGVGYEVMYQSLNNAVQQALDEAQIQIDAIAGTALGVAGYDWPTEYERTKQVIERVGIQAPYRVVNDTILGLVAGAKDGWGVVVVAGTGCNCRGWDKVNKREGRVTGYGIQTGEYAGATELVYRAKQLVCQSWTMRLPPTKLTDLFMEITGAKDVDDLIEGLTELRLTVGTEHAPKIFEVARRGDKVAQDLINWAGVELAEMANSVIRQLKFEKLEFDVVLLGGMYKAGAVLTDPMRDAIRELAPGARLVRLEHPPVLGAVLMAMTEGDADPSAVVRGRLIDTLQQPVAEKV
jgi:N-acetylglucosamine kinase-like BadF-type ATPase